MGYVNASVSLYETIVAGLVADDGKFVALLHFESTELALCSTPTGLYAIDINLGGAVAESEVAILRKIELGAFLAALYNLAADLVQAFLLSSRARKDARSISWTGILFSTVTFFI